MSHIPPFLSRSLIGNRNPLDPSMTHIVIEASKIATTGTAQSVTPQQLRSMLTVAPGIDPFPPLEAHVVSTHWLTACKSKNTHVVEEGYKVLILAADPPAPAPAAAPALPAAAVAPVFAPSSSSSSSSAGGGGDSPARKRARYLDASESQAAVAVVDVLPDTVVAAAAAAQPQAVGAWVETEDTMYFLDARWPLGGSTCTKMIAFDVDDTIIATRSGKHYAQDEHDWKLWHESIVPKFQDLHAQGWYVALVSNQAGLQAGKTSKSGLQVSTCTCAMRCSHISARRTSFYHENDEDEL